MNPGSRAPMTPMDSLYGSGGADTERCNLFAFRMCMLSVPHLDGKQVAHIGSIARNESHHIVLRLCPVRQSGLDSSTWAQRFYSDISSPLWRFSCAIV